MAASNDNSYGGLGVQWVQALKKMQLCCDLLGLLVMADQVTYMV